MVVIMADKYLDCLKEIEELLIKVNGQCRRGRISDNGYSPSFTQMEIFEMIEKMNNHLLGYVHNKMEP